MEKKHSRFIKFIVFSILLLNGNSICKATSQAWSNYFNDTINSAGVKSFKCTYNVSGVNNLNAIIFNVSSSGFNVTQKSYTVDLANNFYISNESDATGKYKWNGSVLNYSDNNTISYNQESFNLINFTENVVEFYACPTKLFLRHTKDNKNYEMFLLKSQSNNNYEYIEISIDAANSEEISVDGDDIYDREPYNPEEDITDLETGKKVRIDDSRSKEVIVQDEITIEQFYNNFLYGDSNFGIIQNCTTYENPLESTLSKVGLSNIKLNDTTIEACLYKTEIKDSFTYEHKNYTGYDQYIKGQYNNVPAVAQCEQGYNAVRLKKTIMVPSGDKSKTTFFYGEVCINNYDYPIKIQEIVEIMKSVYTNINNYNHQCDEEKSKKEIDKGQELILEYNELKTRLGSSYVNKEGDEYALLLSKAEAKCINNNNSHNYDTSPFTGKLTCNGLLGGPNSEVRKIISNILKFIRYGGPILMLLLTIVDLVSTVTSGEDKDFKKVFNNFIKRFIAAALLFFINDIIKLLFLIVGLEYNCIIE